MIAFILHIIDIYIAYKIPIKIMKNPPIIVEIEPIILFILLPNNNPIYVNKKLHIENIIELNKYWLVIFDKPTPTESASKLTAKPNNIIPLKSIIFSHSSFLKVSIIISIPMNDKIMNTIISGFIGI